MEALPTDSDLASILVPLAAVDAREPVPALLNTLLVRPGESASHHQHQHPVVQLLVHREEEKKKGTPNPAYAPGMTETQVKSIRIP